MLRYRQQQIGQASSKLPSQENPGQLPSEDVYPELPCPLPIPLQDLCLLVVINYLDSYPVELLASLPHWLRYHLLNNLPVIDLCRLEQTPIARGVDNDKVWTKWEVKSMVTIPSQRLLHLRRLQRRLHYNRQPAFIENFFQLNVYRSDTVSVRIQRLSGLKTEMESAFKELEGEPKTKAVETKETYLLKLASNVLSQSSRFSLRVDHIKSVAHNLVSIQGDHLLQHLGTTNKSTDKQTTIWTIQRTCLALSHQSTQVSLRKYVLLTPHRLLPIHKRADPVELFSLLTNACNVRPTSVNLDLDMVSQSILDNLQTEMIVADNGLSLPSDSVSCMSIMKYFLENVVILRLQSLKYINTGILIGILEAATVKGSESRLKGLFCSILDVYVDTIQPFSDLFSLPNFHLLHLELEEINPRTLIKLVQKFMTAQCTHNQRLVISTAGSIRPPSFLHEGQLASLDLGGSTVPHCAIQHKTIRTGSQDHLLQFILLLPCVRLTEIVLNDCSSDSYVNLCARHPDLRVARLEINNVFKRQSNSLALLTGIKDDLISLLIMPTLQELSIGGKWDIEEAKLGLALGISQRSQLCLPLKKIVLDMNGYSEEDLKVLWKALFSLPQLHQVEIVLEKRFTEMIKKFSGTIYESWTQFASFQSFISTVQKDLDVQL